MDPSMTVSPMARDDPRDDGGSSRGRGGRRLPVISRARPGVGVVALGEAPPVVTTARATNGRARGRSSLLAVWPISGMMRIRAGR